MSSRPLPPTSPRHDGDSGASPGSTEAPRVRLRTPREGATSPAARLHRPGPLPLLGVVLVLVALIGYIAVYDASTKRTAVLITTRALQPGTVLTPADLRVGEISGDAAMISGLEPGGALAQLVGQHLTSGLPAGTPLARSALSAESTTGSQITLAVSALHALGGALQPGDRVSVLATFGAGSGQAHTRAIARGLQVISVGQIQAGEQPSTATVPVTVALANPSSASALAISSEDGKIDLVLEGAGGTNAAIPEVTDSGSGP
jgi:Flp pilus assembly protein CpaB